MTAAPAADGESHIVSHLSELFQHFIRERYGLVTTEVHLYTTSLRAAVLPLSATQQWIEATAYHYRGVVQRVLIMSPASVTTI